MIADGKWAQRSELEGLEGYAEDRCMGHKDQEMQTRL